MSAIGDQQLAFGVNKCCGSPLLEESTMLSQSRGIYAGALLVLLLVFGATQHMGHGAAEFEQRMPHDHVP